MHRSTTPYALRSELGEGVDFLKSSYSMGVLANRED
jgi:hypothetical protein